MSFSASSHILLLPSLIEQFLLQAGSEIILIVLATIVGLLVLWIIVSIPVWIAAKILTLGRAKFRRAMLVTAVGPIIYAAVLLITSLILTLTFGERALVVAISFIIAFIAWIGVFKAGFDTGWLRAFGIAVLAILVFAIFGVIVTLAIQAVIPGAPELTPIPLQNA